MIKVSVHWKILGRSLWQMQHSIWTNPIWQYSQSTQYWVLVSTYDTKAHWLVARRGFCRHIIEIQAHLRSASKRLRCWDMAWVSMADLQLCYRVFPDLWLKFRHNWDLQSSPEWGCWICMKANFDKLWLIMDVSFQLRHASRATNKPPKCMYPVYSALYILVCFILIMFSLTLDQWM